MKRVLKWVAIIAAGLLGLIILLYLGVSAVSAGRLNRTYEVTAAFSLNVPDDPDSIAEGKRLYTIMCQSCHGEELSGTSSSDLMTGRITMANLTTGAGGIGASRSDEEMARAVWYGVKPDGSPTVVMPPEIGRAVNIVDMEKIIAYIRSAPPADTDHPETRPGPVFRLMHVTGMFPVATAELVDLSAPPPGAVDPEDTLALGMQRAAFCTACHGEDLAGNSIAGGPNITPHETALGAWTEADFIRALREGKRPDGSAISTDMPWETLRLYTDAELSAIWAFLQTVEPVARQR